jgi:LmbE family N-acetylglucosaminyl deacetylase
MNLHQPTAEVFIPGGGDPASALARTTHLAIGAHQDDLEFMAFRGIIECFHSESSWFTGVTCTDGGGSARTGGYADFSDEQMKAVRRDEQRQAAIIARYSAMLQLDYPSRVAKDPADSRLRDDLAAILRATRPRIVYTHNPADKHDTHIAVVIPVLQAIRSLPRELRPAAVHGCEVWRDLDWLPDAEKVIHDVSGHDHLAAAVNGVFDSQIAGGKRYDLATLGRRAANATFFDSHSTDAATQLVFGIDLTPLVADESLDIADYVCGFIDQFKTDVRRKLGQA